MSYVKLSDKLYYGIHPCIVFPDIHFDYFVNLVEKHEVKNCEKLNGSKPQIFYPIPDKLDISNEDFINLLSKLTSLKGILYIFCKDGNGRSAMIAAALYAIEKNISGGLALRIVSEEWKKQRDFSKISPAILKLGSPQNLDQKQAVLSALSGLNYVLFYNDDDIFSNFYRSPFFLENQEWENVEKYFHAKKFLWTGASARSIEYSQLIQEANTPYKTKLLGNQNFKQLVGYKSKWKVAGKDSELIKNAILRYSDVKMRNDWDKIRIDVMIYALTAKFTQNFKLKKKIMSYPDNTYFVEHTPRDKFWADGGDYGDGSLGKNMLGKILTCLSYLLKHKNNENISSELRKHLKS